MRVLGHSLLYLVPAVLLAQNTGTLHGVVTDPSGSAVPGTKVTATLVGRGTVRATETDTQGAYILPFMPVGTYTVAIEAAGFRRFTRQGLTLDAEDNVRVDARLELGATSDSVTVTADATLVDSRSATLGAIIDERSLLDMPLNGRNIIDLAVLLPGVSDVSAPQTFTGDRSGPTFSTSGSRTNQNAFLFDGTQFNGLFRNTGLNFPPPDAVSEVKALTNQYSAEYGHNAGTVFNVVTKSGSNSYHGSAWEFLRNNAFNAPAYTTHRSTKLIQNQFGGTMGGPIKHNKLFFFASSEGLRVRPAILSSNVGAITSLERTGDFSRTSGTIRDPLTGQPFPNKIIPANRLDPVAVNVLKRISTGTDVGNGLVVFVAAAPQNNTHLLGRADYNAGAHTIDARYNFTGSDNRSAAGDVPSYYMQDNQATVNSITVGDTWVMRPNLVQEIRLGWNRYSGTAAPTNQFNLADLGGKFPVFGPAIPPALSISGRMSLGGGSNVNYTQINESRQVRDAFNWIRDRHSLKFGGDLINSRYLNRSWFQSQGVYSFSGQLSGNSGSDFMLGLPASLNIGVPALEQGARQVSFSGYVQDDWRIAPRLTLNLGVRYDLWLPWVQPNDFWGTFSPGQQSTVFPHAPAGLVYPGDRGVPRGTIQTDLNNFAPRIGFAWDPFGRGKTVIRGGYGIVYEAINADIVQNTLQPFRYSFTIQVPKLSDPLASLSGPIPTTVNLKDPLFVGPYQLFYSDPTMRNPYVQQFSLGASREVLRDLAVTVAYVGKLGRKLPVGLTPNYALPAPNATLANLDQRRIYQGWGNNSEYTTQGNSAYNAMQVQAMKRYARRFMLQGAYTFSRSLDTYSNFDLTPSIPTPFDLHRNWGLSDFNTKHTLTVAWIWDLPRLTSLHGALGGAARWVAGGWQVSGRMTARSGRALNITASGDVAFSGTPNQRPNVTGDPVLPSGRSRTDEIRQWFNPAVFQAPKNGTYGNLGRNAVLGPPSSSNTLGVNKYFRLPGREGMRLQFRSEFFNALNHTTLSGVTTGMGSNLGKISSYGPNRVVQLAMKVLW